MAKLFFRPLQSTHHTFLMFNCHPLMAGVLNTKHESQADCFAVENPEVGIDAQIAEVTALYSKVIFCTKVNGIVFNN